MNQNEIKVFTSVSILIGAISWFIPFAYFSFEVVSLQSLKYLNLGITIAGSFWFLYFKWGWKWDLLRKLLYRPDLNGTWLGEFESDWTDEDGEKNPPREFVLVIRQHWFSVSIRAFTSEQKTESYVETLMLDDSKGSKLLAYLFSEKRTGSGDHGARQGAAELDLSETESEKNLEGHFWTQQGTRGYIKVKLIADKEFVDSFEHALGKWNESSVWASLGTENG